MKQDGAKPGTFGEQAASGVGSTRTWPPSPLGMSNQDWLPPDLRRVPLSCVPPQKRTGTWGTVAIDVYWPIWRFDRVATPGAKRFAIVPFRLCQSASLSALGLVVRPPRLGLNHTPPSLPMRILLLSFGSNANA